MGPDWFSSLVKFFKPGLPLYMAVALGCVVVLLLPAPAVEWLNLTEFLIGNRGYFGLVLIFAATLTLSFGTVALPNSGFIKRIVASRRAKANAKKMRRSFDELRTDEKFLLNLVVHSHESYFHFPPQDKAIHTLVDKGWVEYDVGSLSGNRFKIPWDRWEALRKNRAHIGLKMHYPDSDKSEIERVAQQFQGCFKL